MVPGKEKDNWLKSKKIFFSKDGQYFTILQKHTVQPLPVHTCSQLSAETFQYFYMLWVDHCGMGSHAGHSLELTWAFSKMNIQQVKLLVQRMQLFGVLPCSLPSISVVYFLSLNEGHLLAPVLPSLPTATAILIFPIHFPIKCSVPEKRHSRELLGLFLSKSGWSK